MHDVGDTLHELWRDLRTQKLRTALSLLGIAWGTLATVLLLAFSFGFEELFLQRSRGLGDAIAIAWPGRTTRAAQGFPAGRLLQVTRDDVLAVGAAVPELEAISAEFSRVERVRLGGSVHRVPVSGVEPCFTALRSLRAAPGGRFPNERDSALRARVLFLGDRLASTLFPGQDALGKTLVLQGLSFTVVGVLQHKEQDSDYGGQDQDRAWLPATTFLATFGARFVDDFVYRARDARAPERCSDAVRTALARQLQFDPDDRDALNLWDTTEQQRMLSFIFLGFHVMLAIGGVFTLVVGGLGIAHLMHLMVRRRTTEIGLKLAVGALPSRVRTEWLLQALALVASGSGGGLLLAVAAIAAVRGSPLAAKVGQPHLPPLVAIAAAALLGGVAFVAGYLPARAASRLDPVQALRGGS